MAKPPALDPALAVAVRHLLQICFLVVPAHLEKERPALLAGLLASVAHGSPKPGRVSRPAPGSAESETSHPGVLRGSTPQKPAGKRPARSPPGSGVFVLAKHSLADPCAIPSAREKVTPPSACQNAQARRFGQPAPLQALGWVALLEAVRARDVEMRRGKDVPSAVGESVLYCKDQSPPTPLRRVQTAVGERQPP
ncbi:hypothetical protein GLOTRDRAFT_133831 [Gloeophyllum trabeum ATCC 11539]|uniref:Uncharacterized protein n=1 Tax=Gloeophyllum trabeum (strain ATCC 11539 / FP-39264 / Madison 617) TaxID=670483 RepID=S7RE40_GLOTA|nr:uncharacterized protein GLOTRDRAFT_133831 [Gloeophyllum trabeum ATCC 11539]EPQ50729.1 hypothetical protein GLOTRDRAFT_133831 [Gloeophyllum trabeum ATCC 11539]